jgi:chemotaxis protein methyltransferase WspC
MALQLIEQILNRCMGLDAASIGAPAVARAVQTRMTARQLDGPAAYLEQLRASPLELQALVETVVVPETWFFREREAFVAVAALAAKAWLGNPARPPMRLLSAPCSTGEEPYSMAMALIDAGLPVERFVIDALDISGQSLGRAREGVYGKNSFRGADLSFRDRHFVPAPGGLRIGDAARASVRFKQANLLADEGVGAAEGYDVVFCRNLLIYFDAETQRRAIEILRRLLRPDGLLFVGPGEANLLLGAAFASARIPLAFAFRKAQPPAPAVFGAAPRRAATPALSAPAPVEPRRGPFSGAPRPGHSRPTQTRPAPARPALAAAPAAGPALAEIRRLADQGRLSDAARACEEHLRGAEPSAEAWRLLGILRDASGELAGAADCYRKALYLDPADGETLAHLALLLERQGDLAGAKLVGARAQRLKQKEAL